MTNKREYNYFNLTLTKLLSLLASVLLSCRCSKCKTRTPSQNTCVTCGHNLSKLSQKLNRASSDATRFIQRFVTDSNPSGHISIIKVSDHISIIKVGHFSIIKGGHISIIKVGHIFIIKFKIGHIPIIKVGCRKVSSSGGLGVGAIMQPGGLH